jgi:hypothetical protein
MLTKSRNATARILDIVLRNLQDTGFFHVGGSSQDRRSD